MNTKARFLLLFILSAVSFGLSAQYYDLGVIRNSINNWQSLQGCALSTKAGTIAWYGNNGYQCANINPAIGDILQEINRNGQSIDYVSLADNGYYVIIHNNGNSYHALGPQAFYDALNSVVNNGGIKSASLDEFGHYFILGKNGTVKSDLAHWINFYNSQKQTMGEGKSVWVANGLIVVCYENGVRYQGSAPTNFYNLIQNLDFAPDLAQVQTCGNYVVSCKNGRSLYQLNNFNRTDFVPCTQSNMTTSSPAPVYYAPAPTAPTLNPCGVCHQTGRCWNCGGTGISIHASGIRANCGACGATGRCPTCNGRGYY